MADQLDVYREALLIFYGKVSIYLRAIDGPCHHNGSTGSAEPTSDELGRHSSSGGSYR